MYLYTIHIDMHTQRTLGCIERERGSKRARTGWEFNEGGITHSTEIWEIESAEGHGALVGNRRHEYELKAK